MTRMLNEVTLANILTLRRAKTYVTQKVKTSL